MAVVGWEEMVNKAELDFAMLGSRGRCWEVADWAVRG